MKYCEAIRRLGLAARVPRSVNLLGVDRHLWENTFGDIASREVLRFGKLVNVIPQELLLWIYVRLVRVLLQTAHDVCKSV